MQKHNPVLAKEIIDYLPENTKTIFDGTLGHGGHAQAILEYLKSHVNVKNDDVRLIGVDRDETILNKTKINLNKYKNIIFFENNSYANIEDILTKYGIEKIDFMLLDLGVNMEHFKDETRGFSIKSDSELDMRFDKKQALTAKKIINTYSISQICELLINYGDFNKKISEHIGSEIVNYRKKNEIKTTLQLVELLKEIGLGTKKIAVLFQCIRIEVNNELEELKRFLEKFTKYLSKGGICSIITYHSIEDRIVKLAFKETIENGEFQLVNKHVIKPTFQEINKNKAARSAKLRLIKHL